ncbi:hypothetical protein Ae168Ps1_5188c [Pseudonocardia sp. Ae168_Ps1]|nr:hypothetical protein Ae168Ps1_5188c [Pseudonocardia sp. Ae168_Ps1]OLL83105.1 hypothetical protein Ae263Ps1_0160 [Pseudonocardia sp. Ae263_Ps1]
MDDTRGSSCRLDDVGGPVAPGGPGPTHLTRRRVLSILVRRTRSTTVARAYDPDHM